MDGPVVLVDAESDVERGLVTEWLRAHDVHPREVLPIDAKALAEPLADLADDVPVTPVRVAWLPREREGSRRVRWSDVVSLDAGARVRPRACRRGSCAASRTGRRWWSGEPATVGELRRRYGRPGAGGLRGVRRPPGHPRARTGRARRSLGDHVKVPRLIVEAIEDSPEYRQRGGRARRAARSCPRRRSPGAPRPTWPGSSRR